MFVEELWMPEHTPPQLTPLVVENLQDKIREHGAIEIANGAIEDFQTKQERVGAYIDELGFDLNLLSSDGNWPAWALRFGAAIACLGYNHSDQSVTVDETFDLSKELAELEGIPDAYACCMYGDLGLQAVMRTAFEDGRLRPPDGDGLLQISEMGAGCVRFYMHDALIAA